MIDKFNREGYCDPTAYAALINIETAHREEQRATSYRPLVYICSPFSGNTAENAEKAREYSRFAVRQGVIPVAPHLLYPQFLDESDPKDRELGCLFGLVLLGKCREVWVFGSNVSSGMAKEISKAKYKGMPIRFFTEDCEEVSNA